MTVRDTVPPTPVHDRENALLAESGPVDSEPAAGFGPDHAPDAMHEVELVADQLSVAAPPWATIVRSTLSETAGEGGGGDALSI